MYRRRDFVEHVAYRRKESHWCPDWIARVAGRLEELADAGVLPIA